MAFKAIHQLCTGTSLIDQRSTVPYDDAIRYSNSRACFNFFLGDLANFFIYFFFPELSAFACPLRQHSGLTPNKGVCAISRIAVVWTRPKKCFIDYHCSSQTCDTWNNIGAIVKQTTVQTVSLRHRVRNKYYPHPYLEFSIFKSQYIGPPHIDNIASSLLKIIFK